VVADKFLKSWGGLMKHHNAMIALIDQDPSVGQMLTHSFKSSSYHIDLFSTAEDFLKYKEKHIYQLVLVDSGDSSIPALRTLVQLIHRSFSIPVMVISAQASIPMAVAVIKAGAQDFFEKPLQIEYLVSHITSILGRSAKKDHVAGTSTAGTVSSLSLLTRRERDVLDKIAHGDSNKEAGRVLGISPRTIEVHRARIMEKLSARNTADLVRIVYSEEIRA
jgi:two-component system, LuxR family, response regulator FixJ